MKESIRRPVLFAVIVIVGSILILFDVPLVILIPLILITGFGILIILGALTVAEITSALCRLRLKNLKKTGILKRLDGMKFFEKKPSVTGKKEPAKPATKSPAPKKAEKDAKVSISEHLRSFTSSIKSLGSVLRQRSKKGKKVEDINTLLDKTVSEKVHAPPPAKSAVKADTKMPLPAGGAGSPPKNTMEEEDPFLSLSGDEFDLGLLDGLDDSSMPGLPSSGPEAQIPDPGNDSGSGEPDLPPPSVDLSSAAGDILKESGESLEEFTGLDSGDSADTDFGDLDSISLDGLEGDLGEGTPDTISNTGAATPAAPGSAGPAKPAENPAIKTAWISSDAPQGAGEAEDQVSTQADMASFASGSSGDEDLLSSIASDVKHVKKDKDISLLRELKDFKAPAGEIEQELTGVFEQLNSAQQTRKKSPDADKRVK